MKCLSYWLCYIYSLIKLVKFLSLCYRMLCFWWIKIIKLKIITSIIIGTLYPCVFSFGGFVISWSGKPLSWICFWLSFLNCRRCGCAYRRIFHNSQILIPLRISSASPNTSGCCAADVVQSTTFARPDALGWHILPHKRIRFDRFAKAAATNYRRCTGRPRDHAPPRLTVASERDQRTYEPLPRRQLQSSSK